VNVAAAALRWDPYPIILLNLVSTQAAYAAPLILSAQNRHANRDRVALNEDRARAARTKAAAEYVAHELAVLRNTLEQVATRDDLRNGVDTLAETINAAAVARNRIGSTARGRSQRLSRPDDG